MKQSTKNFLRPDIKKIIVFLLIIGPLMASLVVRIPPCYPHAPCKFYIMNAWLRLSQGIPIIMLIIVLGGLEGARLRYPFLALLAYIIGIYCFSCLIVWGWNKFFILFSKKTGWVIKIALLLLFVLFGIILPAINSLLR